MDRAPCGRSTGGAGPYRDRGATVPRRAGAIVVGLSFVFAVSPTADGASASVTPEASAREADQSGTGTVGRVPDFLTGLLESPDILAGPDSLVGPLRELAILVGPAWVGGGAGFTTALTYEWLLDGHILGVANDVLDGEGRVMARYRGVYAWDAGRDEVVFWTASESGEVHRGRAWWQDGVLWHEAEVSGGRIESYASAVRPTSGRLEYFAAYGERKATPALLDGQAIVYRPGVGGP
jgi:hypothetical protein